MSGFDAVLKVGGSLGRGEALRELCRAIAVLGERRRLLVIPGGGEFADQVRAAYGRYGISETAAHRMALLAMDQYGCLLADLTPGSLPVTGLLAAREAVAQGKVAILLPASLLIEADPLPNSWQVTSDSIAAWVAGIAGARLLVLLKDVDGLSGAEDGSGEVLGHLTGAQLHDHRGGVDEYLATVLGQWDLETWVINGAHPARLGHLLETGRTVGTRIQD